MPCASAYDEDLVGWTEFEYAVGLSAYEAAGDYEYWSGCSVEMPCSAGERDVSECSVGLDDACDEGVSAVV